MTVKEHLTKTYTRQAESHLTKAKAFRSLGKCFAKMNKASGVESDVDPEDLQGQCDVLADEETSMGEFCLECCAGIGKASEGDLAKSFLEFDRIAADNVSGLVGEIPQGVRAVLRAGQRELGKSIDVDPTLTKILGED